MARRNRATLLRPRELPGLRGQARLGGRLPPKRQEQPETTLDQIVERKTAYARSTVTFVGTSIVHD